MRVNEKRRKKYKEIVSHARNYVYAKIKIINRTGRVKIEKRYNRISVYFEEIIIRD